MNEPDYDLPGHGCYNVKINPDGRTEHYDYKTCYRCSCDVDGFCKLQEREKHIADAAKPKKVTTKFKKRKYGMRNTSSPYDTSMDGSVAPLDLFSLHIGMKPLHVVPCLSLRQFLEIQKTSFDHE